MKVVEKFISINGEGRRAGELAVFIRFKGCNYNTVPSHSNNITIFLEEFNHF